MINREDFERKFNVEYPYQNITLSEAVELVIRQNRSIDYRPIRFENMTERGKAIDLADIIGHLVLKAELLETLKIAIKRYGDVLTIEDLIANKNNDFGLPGQVLTLAKARSQWFCQLRRPHGH